MTWRPAHVDVVTGDGIARGVMVTDLLAKTTAPEPNCRIATAIDVEAFMQFFLDTISSL